jgi:hypothetical protein
MASQRDKPVTLLPIALFKSGIQKEYWKTKIKSKVNNNMTKHTRCQTFCLFAVLYNFYKSCISYKINNVKIEFQHTTLHIAVSSSVKKILCHASKRYQLGIFTHSIAKTVKRAKNLIYLISLIKASWALPNIQQALWPHKRSNHLPTLYTYIHTYINIQI